MNVMQSPKVLGIIISVRPGYSSGFFSTKDNHQNVFDNPSKETVERTSMTKATPPVGKLSDLSSPAQGQRIPILSKLLLPGDLIR